MNVLELIKQPWHWAVSGTIIGLMVPVLLILGNKKFGISSSLRHICAMCVPANIPFFKYDWKKESWNLFFALGIIVGAVIANTLLENPEQVAIAAKTKEVLASYNITNTNRILPAEIFSFSNAFTIKGFFFLVVGGFLVGFGTRYAGGCTSGHTISGLSNFQWPSLIATICFMIGGFFSANIIVPFLLKHF